MKSTRKIAITGVFCAIAYVFTLLGKLLPISVAGFLNYDPKDIIIVISGFILGPVSALVISVVVPLLELATGLSSTGPFGLIMNILSSGSFACIASLTYKKFKTQGGAIFGLAIATIITTFLMLLWNFFITPFYMHVPRDVVKGMLLPVFLPFNLVKYGINACLAFLIYKPLVTALRRSHIIDDGKNVKSSSKLWITLTALVVLVSLVLALLVLGGVI